MQEQLAAKERALQQAEASMTAASEEKLRQQILKETDNKFQDMIDGLHEELGSCASVCMVVSLLLSLAPCLSDCVSIAVCHRLSMQYHLVAILMLLLITTPMSPTNSSSAAAFHNLRGASKKRSITASCTRWCTKRGSATAREQPVD